MRERIISRRAICLGGAGAALAYVENLAVDRAVNPQWRLDEVTRGDLIGHAKALSSSFDISSFSVTSGDSDDLVRITPNENAFASILLQMAYIDGGAVEVSNVYRFIKERGVKLSHYKRNNFSLGHMNPSNDVNEPVRVGFMEDVVKQYFNPQLREESEIIVYHELSHVIQQARDPQGWDNYSTLENILGYSFQLAIATNIAMRNYNEARRRDILSLGFNLGLGCALGYVAEKAMALGIVALAGPIRPREQEAYKRSEMIKERLLVDEFEGQIFLKEMSSGN